MHRLSWAGAVHRQQACRVRPSQNRRAGAWPVEHSSQRGRTGSDRQSHDRFASESIGAGRSCGPAQWDRSQHRDAAIWHQRGGCTFACLPRQRRIVLLQWIDLHGRWRLCRSLTAGPFVLANVCFPPKLAGRHRPRAAISSGPSKRPYCSSLDRTTLPWCSMVKTRPTSSQ